MSVFCVLPGLTFAVICSFSSVSRGLRVGGHAGVNGNDRAERLAGKATTDHKWLASRKI